MDEHSRRGFLKRCGAVIAGLALARGARGAEEGGAGPKKPPASLARKARVVVARRPGAVGDDLSVHAKEVRAVVEGAMRKLTGAPDLASSLRKMFRPGDRVGIKVNCLAGLGLSTHPELVAVLVEGLRAAGVPAGQIVVWDRSDTDLHRAGFTVRRAGDGPLCYGTNTDYEEMPETVGSVGGCFSRILTRWCTALISVPVLKDHDLAGISGSLKNFYGAIHNPNRYHDTGCDPYVADLNSYPAIRDRLRLVVFDALVAQCHGGPAFRPEHAWPFGGVIVSADPVAADRVAWRIIEERRKAKGLPTLAEAKREPVWIASAAKLGLGAGDPARIEEMTA